MRTEFMCSESLGILLLLLSCCSMAQTADTSLLLPAQTITAAKTGQFWADNIVQQIDSVTRLFYTGSDLAQLLADASAVAIKSYGPGSLSTLALRGLGAQQTTVLWNGFSLQSPMNGVADLGLLGIFFADDVNIYFAKQSTLKNTENTGGTIQLNSRPHYGSGFQIQGTVGAGSYGRIYGAVKAGYGTERFSASLRAQFLEAENNFTFTNPTLPGKPKTRQQNAQLKQAGFMYALHGNANNGRQEWGLTLWYEGSHRHIPPPATAGKSVAWQNDGTLRVTANWKCNGLKTTTEVKTALFTEKLYYKDSLYGIFSNNRSLTAATLLETQWQSGKHITLLTGMAAQYQSALADAYSKQQQQQQASVFAMGKGQWLSGKIGAMVSIKQGLVNFTPLPFLASAGLEVRLSRQLMLHFGTSKNYRLPTFNDLYWQPGGNPELQPETGWMQELALNCRLHTATSIKAALYSNFVTNWIQWLPDSDNSNLWRPVNQSKVWARGAELHFTGVYRAGKAIFRIQSTTSYQLTGKKEGAGYTRQFIYVPRFTQQNSLHVALYKTGLLLQANYAGKRYTTTDNSRYLSAYGLVNLGILQQVHFKKAVFVLQAKLNNLFNKSYQTIEYRPMPGRFYEISITAGNRQTGGK